MLWGVMNFLDRPFLVSQFPQRWWVTGPAFGVWSWRWTSQLGSIFFSPGIFTAQQKSTTLSHTFLFHFARFTWSVLYQFLPAMTKSVIYFFLQNQTGNYLLTQKRKAQESEQGKAKYFEQHCRLYAREAISPGVCSSRRQHCCASLPPRLPPTCTAITGSEI